MLFRFELLWLNILLFWFFLLLFWLLFFLIFWFLLFINLINRFVWNFSLSVFWIVHLDHIALSEILLDKMEFYTLNNPWFFDTWHFISRLALFFISCWRGFATGRLLLRFGRVLSRHWFLGPILVRRWDVDVLR
jgi:hypothetical protein